MSERTKSERAKKRYTLYLAVDQMTLVHELAKLTNGSVSELIGRAIHEKMCEMGIDIDAIDTFPSAVGGFDSAKARAILREILEKNATIKTCKGDESCAKGCGAGCNE